MFDIGTTDAYVLECFIAQTRQQFALTMKFVPAGKLVQQIGYRMNGESFFRYVLMLTFHLVVLRWGWLKSRSRDKINPTNVSDGNHLGD